MTETIINNSFLFYRIIYAYRGSIAHNMYVPPEEEMGTDDVDLMGVAIPPISYYLGLDKFEQTQIQEGKDDIIIYELTKFIRLLIKGNPNVISLLWNDPQMYLELTEEGKILIENRELFSTKWIPKAFLGYANAQMKKMFSGSYQGYMGEKRKKFLDKFGYDVKNAAHMIRLLRMCREFLITGRMNVYREDAEELINIKKGKWSSNKIIQEANLLTEDIKKLLDVSTLPEKVNYNEINNLITNILMDYPFDEKYNKK